MKTREELLEILWQDEYAYVTQDKIMGRKAFNSEEYKERFNQSLMKYSTEELQQSLINITIFKAQKDKA